jgi:hypothetical protein
MEARNTVMSVPIAFRRGELVPEPPRPLFKTTPYMGLTPVVYPYDVTPDGKRFIVNIGPIDSGSTTTLTLVTNWSGLVKPH